MEIIRLIEDKFDSMDGKISFPYDKELFLVFLAIIVILVLMLLRGNKEPKSR